MPPDLTDLSYLRKILRQKGIALKRSAGQHFLICPEVIKATIQAVQNGSKKVTELGAGLGTLTQALLNAGCCVKAIENDFILANTLLELIPAESKSRLELVREDLRAAPWTWPRQNGWQIAGNIPYNLSGLIIRRIVELDPEPQQAILLVQKEVGERLCAKTPKTHLISLAVQLWGSARIVMPAPADCFWPAPQVDSCLVVLKPHTASDVVRGMLTTERKKIMDLARVFFQHKRKQIQIVIRHQWKMTSAQALILLQRANINATARPQELTVEQWRGLARVIYLT